MYRIASRNLPMPCDNFIHDECDKSFNNIWIHLSIACKYDGTL